MADTNAQTGVPGPEKRLMATANPSTIIAVIVTFNGRRWYGNCLSSLLANGQKESETLVVDNGSTDGTADLIQKEFPGIQVIRLTRNLGYAAGANGGIREALAQGADYVLLLNTDTKVRSGCRQGLLQAAAVHPEFGVLSPMQYNYEGTELDENFAKWYRVEDSASPPDPLECETVIGAAMFVSRAVFEKVGGFDPGYFMYGEEDDFCRRARYHGFKVGITSRAAICHWHAMCHKDDDWRRRGLLLRNTFLYELKDPRYSTVRQLYLYFRYCALKEFLSAIRRRHWVMVRRIIWAHLCLLPKLPRTLLVRKRERKGACHL